LTQNGSNKLTIILIFAFFFLVYVTSSSGHFDPWDGMGFFLLTESMALKHSAKLYPDQQTVQQLSTHSSPIKPNFPNACDICDLIIKPTYSVGKPYLLTPAMAVPFYYAALLFSVPPVTVVALFANSFIMSLTCVVLFCFSLALYESKKIAFVLTLIFGVCSFIWPYNSSLMSDPTKALCVFASTYFIYIAARQDNTERIRASSNNSDSDSGTTTNVISRDGNKNKRVYFAGLGALFLGLSVFAHPTSSILIPGFLVYFIFSIRHCNNRKILLISFLLVLGAVLLFAGFTNYIRFGSFTKFGLTNYEEGATLSVHRQWQGLVGLLISPGKGLIFYFPIAILLPLAFRYMYAKNKGLFFISTYTFVATWLFFGTIFFLGGKFPAAGDWGGLWWGPRYLMVTLPFIALASGTLFEHLKRNKILKVSGLIILCFAGFLVNLLGVLVWWEFGNVYNNAGLGKDTLTPKVWTIYHSYIAADIGILMSNFVSQIQPVKFSAWSFTLLPCPYDNYLFCKFGIMPILLLSTVIAIVGIIIITRIGVFQSPSPNPKTLLVK
jgi:hypothetical protein